MIYSKSQALKTNIRIVLEQESAKLGSVQAAQTTPILLHSSGKKEHFIKKHKSPAILPRTQSLDLEKSRQ